MEKQQNTEHDAPNIHSEHLKEEFYKWFESRGLLSDLRAYMRQLMVKALEDSHKNGKTQKQRKSSTSPKLQAINLIVVDYLFHEDYLYTVSVFASEAQFLDGLPQYSQYITQTVKERRWDPSSLPRFSQTEVEDILDTLHLPPTQSERQETTSLYISGRESLLTCVVRTLASSRNQRATVIHEAPEDLGADLTVESSPQLWSSEMQSLLLLGGVKLQHIRRMQQKWAQTIEEEKEKARQEAAEELSSQESQWREETERRVRAELAEQLRAEQLELRERQSRAELRERGLASLAEQLTAVHDDINHRLSQMQLRNQELLVREARLQNERLELDRRFSELQVREEHLQRSYSLFRGIEGESKELEEESLPKDTQREEETTTAKPPTETEDATVQTEVEDRVGVTVDTQTVEPVTVAFTQTTHTADHEQQTSLAAEVDPQLTLQLQTDHDRINALQEENLELRAHTLQQRHRIDELTNRAASLASQLEESQVAVAVLSGRDSAVSTLTAHHPPPLAVHHPPPVFITPTFGYNTPQRSGAGEENLFAARPQQATPRSDARRRPTRFAFSQNPPQTSEESSPTDEVIQNARARIQQLEQESVAVQRNFQDFQNRLLATDSVMFPPLGAPRNRNPMIRVRRSDATSFTPYPEFPSCSQSLRPAPVLAQHYDENTESSSDQAAFYERHRIDSMITGRRLFTQRNFRQFERWKEFKKKFYKQEPLDNKSRRNNSAVVNYSSSDEDDCYIRKFSNKREIRRGKKGNKTKATNLQEENLADSKSDTKRNVESHVTFADDCTALAGPVETNELFNTTPTLFDTGKSAKTASKQSQSIPCASKKADAQSLSADNAKLKLEVERTEKLIESVKELLADQNKHRNSTLSNGSLPLDSLPRDSQGSSFLEVHNTDNSSLLTVQRAKSPANQRLGLEKTKENSVHEKSSSSCVVKSPTSNTPSQELLPGKIESTQLNKDLNYDKEEGDVLDVVDNNPEPLDVPTLRLVSPGLAVESEDIIAAEAFHTADVAEKENGDRATTSVTSGSDIMRELNPSKTESSSSLMSGGWAEDSKHSSDFWN